MYVAYEDVLKRLKEERHRLSLTQNDMSRCVRMSQSNYSKIELGLRRLNYYELKYLCESDVDVHYIYTGLKSNGQYNEFFSKCKYAEINCFLSVIYSIAVLRSREREAASGKWKDILERIKYVPLIEDSQKPYNIFLAIRRSQDYRQQKMAEIIGVDVKKLRDLENGRCLPDSELLCRLYELFRIPPAAILKDKKSMESEISLVLEMMDLEEQEKLFDVIKTLYHMN